MATNKNIEEPMKRALEAVERRFALAEGQTQIPQKRDKRRRHEQNPGSETAGYVGSETAGHTYSQICHSVHENLFIFSEISNKEKSTVDKIIHGLLQKGDSAQKYIQGSRSAKFFHIVLLDNHVKGKSTSVACLQALKANSKRSKKHMSMKQLKKCGLFELPEGLHEFELFIQVHQIWKEYVMKLLQNAGKNQVAAILFSADLHGAILRVVECKIDSFVGVFGVMICETAETFGIITGDNKYRVVPKRSSVFVLQADFWRITLNGDRYISRKLVS